MVTCLPRCKGSRPPRCVDRLFGRVGKELEVVVHVGTRDIGKDSKEVLEARFRLLGRRLKSRISTVAQAR